MIYFYLTAALALVAFITSLFANKWVVLVGKIASFATVLGGLCISYQLVLGLQYILALISGRII